MGRRGALPQTRCIHPPFLDKKKGAAELRNVLTWLIDRGSLRHREAAHNGASPGPGSVGSGCVLLACGLSQVGRGNGHDHDDRAQSADWSVSLGDCKLGWRGGLLTYPQSPGSNGLLLFGYGLRCNAVVA